MLTPELTDDRDPDTVEETPIASADQRPDLTEAAAPRRLHEISADLLAIEAAILDADGEITPALGAALDAATGDLSAKVDGYLHLIRDWRADAQRCDAEAQRMATRAQQRDRAADALEARLLAALQTLDRPRIETAHYRVRVQHAAARVDVPDPKRLPPEYQRVRTIVDVDRQALARRLGGTVGAELTDDHGNRLASLVQGTAYLVVR